MHRVVLLAIAVLLAGCVNGEVRDPPDTPTTVVTLYEGSVTLAPPDQAESVTVELEKRASDVTIELEGQGNVNLRVEGSGCPERGDSNIFVGASGSNHVTVTCGNHAPGTFVFTVSRDAGEGPVSVIVTGRIALPTSA